jgi:hypothetical protein
MNSSRSHEEVEAVSTIFSSGLAAKIAVRSCKKGPTSWLSVLSATTNFASTECRDRLYALISICGEIPGFDISYTASVPEVFRDFTMCMIRYSNNLELIRLAGVNHEVTLNPFNLPSWIPNYANLDHPILQYHKLLGNNHYADYMRSGFKIWKASPFETRLSEPTANSDFRPEGVQVGTI